MEEILSFLEEEPCCSVCEEVFSVPVALCCVFCECSLCEMCFQQLWEKQGCEECPVCTQDRPGSHLTKCKEQRKEAELKNALNPLKEKLKLLRKTKETYEQITDLIKTQAEFTEKQLRQEFKELHRFLLEEEESRLSALQQEHDQKWQIINDKVDDLDIDITSLTITIRAVEEEMRSLDIPFLKKYKDTIKRTWRVPQDPEMIAGSLLDVAKHLGSLKYQIWEGMKEMIQYTPVTLDPNTASSCFILSDDLTTLQCNSYAFRLPDNPERFNVGAEVLAYEGFSSGLHSWDVEVKDNTYWVIGVASASIDRKGKHVLTPAEGFWTIRLRNGEYKACTAPWSPLTMSQEPQVIRVVLDMGRSRVTFYDPRVKTPLFTFKDMGTLTAHPYFCSACKDHPLKVLPAWLCVTAQECPAQGFQ